MAACTPSPHSLRLNPAFGSLLCRKKNWYAVSSEWCNRPKDFWMVASIFKDDITEILIYDLVSRNGAQVDPSLFGSSRKKIWSLCLPFLASWQRQSTPTQQKMIRCFSPLHMLQSKTWSMASELINWQKEVAFPPQFTRHHHLRQKNLGQISNFNHKQFKQVGKETHVRR